MKNNDSHSKTNCLRTRDEKIHDEIRGRKESWKRAIAAIEHVRNAGMDPYLNITVGHYNANTDHFKQLLDYSKAFQVQDKASLLQKQAMAIAARATFGFAHRHLMNFV